MPDKPTVESLHTQTRQLRDALRQFANDPATEQPKAQALCETGAEVVGGLEKAFDHFLAKSETAWQ